jgi:large subunit ribosomal protein L1
MSKHGKKYRAALSKISGIERLPIEKALEKIKEVSFVKFDESVDVAVNLGIDPTKGEQIVRGSVILPHGRGKKVRVLVFAKGDYAEQARQAGADYVGLEDLITKIESGWLEFDSAIATPDVMSKIGTLAKILGPRGLLPNQKTGTVTFDVAKVINEFKRGKSFFRNDKQGIVHISIGRASFSTDKLRDNFEALIQSLVGSKPQTSKGKFIKKLSVSSTMGVGIQVDADAYLQGRSK